MNFLFPAMLAGLAALAVPVILHLIARHRFSVQELPTIRFLDKQERTNVLAPKLVDPWQLLLRLLVLILLVLAMGRWFAGWKTGAPAPRNVILVVDTSASMRMELPLPGGAGKANLLEHARRHARTVIADLGPGSRCGLIADRADAPADLAPTTETAGITAALEKLEAIDGSGRGLVRAVADACDQLRGRREVKSQIVVLTDLRATAFQNRDQQALERTSPRSVIWARRSRFSSSISSARRRIISASSAPRFAAATRRSARTRICSRPCSTAAPPIAPPSCDSRSRAAKNRSSAPSTCPPIPAPWWT